MTEAGRSRPLLGFSLLILFNLLLISVQVRSEDGRTLLRSWGLMIFTPVSVATDFVIDGVRDTFSYFGSLQTFHEENSRLSEENRLLKNELHRLRALDRVFDRDARFAFIRDLYAFDTVLAGVVWRSFPAYNQTLVVNVGERHGVRKDSAVITADGVVGRITTTTLLSSEVQLLSDANAAAAVTLEDSRLQGIIQGTGGSLLLLNFIPNTEVVPDGELLVTSGGDRIYPRGLPVGTVLSSQRGAIYQRISIKPAVDLNKVEEVAVVIGAP
jgi:rod shape-determining protein MreC